MKPSVEHVPTPDNYRRFPGGADLPDTLPAWKVQTGTRSYNDVVSRSYGWDDSPDAEALAPGLNNGKESGAVAVGRHGNFLQWGFSGEPSRMTPAGRNFFLNCICYISRFDGRQPLVTRVASHRMNSVRLAALIDQITNRSFFSGSFRADLMDSYSGRAAELSELYRKNIERVYKDRYLEIDDDLLKAGILSNREIATLERLVSLLSDKSKADIATMLLKRYTVESFTTPEEWQAWFEKNRDRIYFSDVGGYKFRVVPEGYLDIPPLKTTQTP